MGSIAPFPLTLHNDGHPLPVMLSRSETSPGEAARAEREEPRSRMTRSRANEFALRAEILRGGSE
jgi:hypothetical protein